MQECDKFRVHFSSYIEGELIFEERQALEAHLAVCHDCSETLYQMKIIRRSLQSLPTITTSTQFEYRLNQKIANLNNASPWTAPLLNLRQNWKIPAIGSAVASIIIVGVLLLSPTQQQASKNMNSTFTAPLKQGAQFSNTSTTTAEKSAGELQAMPSDSSYKIKTPPRRNSRPVQLVGD